jgi:hypothetical protein
MSLIVLLDAGPLGMITNPKSSPENEACKNWLASLAYNGAEVVIPEIGTTKYAASCFGPARREGLAVWTR